MPEPDFSALWAAFRAKDRDRVIVGVAAAFALVVASDGKIESVETQRFLEVVRGSRLAPADDATRDALGAAFADLARALVDSPALGRTESLRVLSDFGFDPMRREIIWSATHAALIADAVLAPAEQAAATAIREALRLPRGAR
jgi:hypothetical protein